MNSNWCYSPETLKSGQNGRFFLFPCDLENWRMTLKNNMAHLLHHIQLFCTILKPSVNSNLNYSLETLESGQNWRFFVPYDLDIWQMTLKNNTAHLLCNFKLCASFRSHEWNQTGVTVRKRPIVVKIDHFFSRVTLKFDGWSWNTKGHLSEATSSFVHHLITTCEFKLELQSGNG